MNKIAFITGASSGIGKALVERADCYFIENNCVKAEVTSGEHRDGAHQLYMNQGYAKDMRRFIKIYNQQGD